jgi:hypothetical protein
MINCTTLSYIYLHYTIVLALALQLTHAVPICLTQRAESLSTITDEADGFSLTQ